MDFWAGLSVLVQIVLIDLSVAGENAIVVGMATASLPPQYRRRALLFGIAAATVLRIIFSLATVQLMKIIGLTLAGGFLLLWVAYGIYRQIRNGHESADFSKGAPSSANIKTLKGAVLQIVIADVSMSLDNVLAVAGAAREHLVLLVLGLILSVILMGAAASAIARLLNRYHWIGYAGFVVVLYVALRMIIDGGAEVNHWFSALTP